MESKVAWSHNDLWSFDWNSISISKKELTKNKPFEPDLFCVQRANFCENKIWKPKLWKMYKKMMQNVNGYELLCNLAA